MFIGRDELGHRSETVRRANLSAIVRELHASGPLSRSELVARTGLTRSAIRGLIGELVAGRLVFEGPAALDGTPGRPSPVVRADPNGAVVLALEIAVDSLAAATVGLGGEVFDLVRVDLPRKRSSVADIATVLADLATDLRGRLPSEESLVGVGVAVVGVVRRSDGMVSVAPNLGWRDEPLGEVLGKALQMDVPMAFANEADLAVLAEHRRGAARDIDDVLLIWGSIGVGGGLIVDGQPLIGAAGYGGEVGHIPVNPDGLPCRCGSIGCWETEVGTMALLRRAGRSPEAGREAVRDAARGGRGRRSGRARRIRRDGTLARHRSRRDRQRVEPESRPARRSPDRQLSLRPVDPGGRARSARVARLAPARPGRADIPRR